MKPNKIEDEYIWVQELQQRLAKQAKLQQVESAAEKLRLKETHWMHCPKCGQKLSTEKCGSVEIDVCPSCKGVWLDAGELGSIVESAGHASGSRFPTCNNVTEERKYAGNRVGILTGLGRIRHPTELVSEMEMATSDAL